MSERVRESANERWGTYAKHVGLVGEESSWEVLHSGAKISNRHGSIQRSIKAEEEKGEKKETPQQCI